MQVRKEEASKSLGVSQGCGRPQLQPYPRNDAEYLVQLTVVSLSTNNADAVSRRGDIKVPLQRPKPVGSHLHVAVGLGGFRKPATYTADNRCFRIWFRTVSGA